ncbi:thioredoxin 1 [Deinobacterium chartae]|uniref:Thioredoxin n=1 Tax=Deinobacterium chartae TaxID=521158 RepID=A0A841I548_9DEIO|nr:thioredoxin [Deinobacterium chartae]MBB6100146.1 thioredoxin 1 [Deinobacterium chartae]
MAKPIEITDQTFASEIQKGLTLVDFWAPWCGPCRMIAPVLEELAEEYQGKVRITKLNVDENPETAMKFRVMSIPTLILFRDGQPIDTIVGAHPKRSFVAKFDQHLAAVN